MNNLTNLVTILSIINAVVGVLKSNNKRAILLTTSIVSLLSTFTIYSIRITGVLQKGEFLAYDLMLRSRATQPVNSRILVIKITDSDMENDKYIEPVEYNGQEIIPSISDKRLSLVLEKLEQYKPVAIGLDIYRPFPVSSELEKHLSQVHFEDEGKDKNLFGICLVGFRQDPENNDLSIAPPNSIEPRNIGFSNIWPDSDGVTRLANLYITAEDSGSDTDTCKANNSLNFILANHYLKNLENPKYRGEFKFNKQKDELGFYRFTDDPEPELKSTLHSIKPFYTGAYGVFTQINDKYKRYSSGDSGYRIIINYSASKYSPYEFINAISIQDFLDGKGIPENMDERIVLIGREDGKQETDFWKTPYGEKIPGVILHAQIISQLLDVALEEKTAISVNNFWDFAFIFIISWIGGISVTASAELYARIAKDTLAEKNIRIITAIILLVIVTPLSSYTLLIVYSRWFPIVPALLSLIISMIASPILLKKYNQSKQQGNNLNQKNMNHVPNTENKEQETNLSQDDSTSIDNSEANNSEETES